MVIGGGNAQAMKEANNRGSPEAERANVGQGSHTIEGGLGRG